MQSAGIVTFHISSLYHYLYATKLYHILSVDIRFNSGYITHITTVHTMGSHIVRTLKALNPFQPKLILVHTTITGTCHRAYKTCKNWPLCSYVG